MSSLLRVPRVPRCLSCIHRMTDDFAFLFGPFQSQVRGKKKKPRLPAVVNARLLRNVRGFGSKGTIVPVAPGRMRNIWHPSRTAEYVTNAQLKELGGVVPERDFLFGMQEGSQDGKPGSALFSGGSKKKSVDLDVIRPERTMHIVDSIIPESMDFYRRPVAVSVPEGKKSSRDSAVTTEAESTALPSPSAVSITAGTPIYGSVSTTDIASNIMAILASTNTGEFAEEAGRVVLHPDEITIVSSASVLDGVDGDRIKALGEFDIEIKAKLAEPIRRRVRVMSEA